MKTTNVNTATNNQAGNTKGAGFQIKPGVPVPVSQLIEEAKAKNPDAIKEPTNYPTPNVEPATEPATPTAEQAAPEATTAPASELAAPAQTMALVKSRSRSEEIEFQVEKSAKLQLINTQLQSLKNKLAELKQFSFATEKDEDHRYARIVIYDDNNREFSAKNHGLSSLVVEQLKTIFEQKIDEKENELLMVSRS